jgi:hypothetical protein
MTEYIYIIQEREFIRLNEQTYKIGRTTKTPNNRLMKYPKGSDPIFSLRVDDSKKFESDIINFFKKKFEQKKEYGTEYFSGNLNDMINTIMKIYNNYVSRKNIFNFDDMKNLKINDIKKWIRIKLGQNYANPKYVHKWYNEIILSKNDYNELNNDKKENFRIYHKRFNFDAQKDIEINKDICDIFANDLNTNRIVIYSHKGSIKGYIISNKNYHKYDYWNMDKIGADGINRTLKLPYLYEKELSGYGTVDILTHLVEKSLKMILNNRCKSDYLDYNNCETISTKEYLKVNDEYISVIFEKKPSEEDRTKWYKLFKNTINAVKESYPLDLNEIYVHKFANLNAYNDKLTSDDYLSFYNEEIKKIIYCRSHVYSLTTIFTEISREDNEMDKWWILRTSIIDDLYEKYGTIPSFNELYIGKNAKIEYYENMNIRELTSRYYCPRSGVVNLL